MEDSEKTPLLNSHRSLTPGPMVTYDPEKGVALSRSSGVEGVVPVSLSWTDVQVSVTVPGRRKWLLGESAPPKEKMILKGVSGLLKPGTLLAIMGASGAGKTTLLNMLAHRNMSHYNVAGDICVNGWQMTEKIKNVSAYVQQHDVFFGNLTVREQLQFRALLRMDKSLGTAQRLARVEEVLSEMGLQDVASSRIGNAGGSKTGISGGERKRLSFASEALTNPPLFICDEPTSGVDSFMAQNVFKILKKMAYSGRSVLCTVHQPSSDIFAMFDQILLLAEGRVAFMGSKEEALKHFEKLNYACPTNFNPADHFIMTLAIAHGEEEECKKRTNAICDAFHSSDKAVEIANTNIRLKESSLRQTDCFDGGAMQQASRDESRYGTSWITQFRYLFWRSCICNVRDRMIIRTNVTLTIMNALCIGIIYLQLDIHQKEVMSISGVMFIILINQNYSSLLTVINTFPLEMETIFKEYGSRLYRPDVYYLAKSLSEAPIFLLSGLTFVSIVYWMIGFREDFTAYLIALAAVIMTTQSAIALGYFISILTGSVTTSLTVAIPITFPLLIFGGYFINIANIPQYLIWLKYISWFRYSMEILMFNQWSEINSIPCHNSSTASGAPACHFPTGQDVLDYYSFDQVNIAVNFCVLAGLAVGIRILSFIAFLYRAIKSKE